MLRDTYCYTKACFAQTVPVKATETFFLDRLETVGNFCSDRYAITMIKTLQVSDY